jgi:aspartyl-tRNA(Asn)/glutamyl-tRNA(Gln) amidotransferase subunit A
MCLAAIGSQTGGSITRPAIYCGVAGCKPTYGRVSLSGIVPLAPSLDHPGPLARTVRDLAIVLDVISGHDPADPLSARASYPAQETAPPRLIRLRGFFDEWADREARGALDDALSRLKAAGARVDDVELPPSFAEIHARHQTLLRYELAGWHRERFRVHRDDYLPGLASLLDDGLTISRSAYDDARAHQARARAEIAAIFGEADAAVCPATTGPAPDPSTTGDPAFNSPWSHTGSPTVSFPIGLSADGLPLGLQLVGRHFDEPRLFRAALWCEHVIQTG